MKTLKGSTKAGKNIINKYWNFEGYELEDVYTSYSTEKARAISWCKEQYFNDTLNKEGRGWRICSHNTFGFTCGWIFTENNTDYVRFETKDNTYIVDMNSYYN